MRYRLAAAAASLSLLIGCIAHEKEGDSASAVGDWKTAYVHYRNALAEKPETPGLKPKFDNARTQALAQARQKASTCQQQRDWGCVGAEAQFILEAEPGAPDAAQLMAQASFYQALDLLQQARTAAAQRQFPQAAELVRRARELSNAPEVAAEGGRVQMEIAAAAVAESDRLRQERRYDEALQAMQVAVQYDPSQADRLRAVEQEREQWLAYQYEKAAYDGDKAMAHRDWRGAVEAYRAAQQIRPGGRADGLGRYCDAMARGEAAIQNRQYDAAAAAYQEAVATNLDRGEARRELDRLRVRPYDINIRSVLLVPTRQDGNPWTGPTTAHFFRIAQFIQQHLTSKAFERAVEMAMTVPTENRPEVRVEVMLPDGTRLMSKPVSGLYATFEGSLVMATSGYDERHLAFRVVQKSASTPDGEEIGRMDIALRDLCEVGDVFMFSDSVSQLRVTARAADGRQEGTFAGLTKWQPPPPGTGTAGTPPPPGGTGTAAAPPPPPGQPGGVVTAGGAPPPPGATGSVTYVPPAKPAPPPAAPVAVPPPPQPPPVAPPMAGAPPPGGQPGTPVAAPPPAGSPSDKDGKGGHDEHGKGKGKGNGKGPGKGKGKGRDND